MKQNLNRNHSMTFRVDAGERDFIYKKMEETGITNLRRYLLTMAVCGRVITVDTTDIRECGRLLGIISNNVNQIARRLNTGGNATLFELENIRNELGKVWQQQEKIIMTVTKVMEEDLKKWTI